MRIPVRNALIALVLHAGVIAIAMFAFDLNIYAVAIGTIVFSLIMCILNGLSVKKYSGFTPNIMKTFIKPAIASVIMGIVVFAVYFAGSKVIPSSICTILAILVGVITYAVALLLIRGLTEEELESFPKGTLIIRIAKKFHLL